MTSHHETIYDIDNALEYFAVLSDNNEYTPPLFSDNSSCQSLASSGTPTSGTSATSCEVSSETPSLVITIGSPGIENPRRLVRSKSFADPVSTVGSLLKTDPRFVNWSYVSTLKLSVSEYAEFKDYLDWDIVSTHISFDVARLFKNRINWNLFLSSTKVDFNDLFDWSIFSDCDYDWEVFLKHQDFSQTYLNMYLDEIEPAIPMCWDFLTQFVKLSERFIQTHADKVNWDNVCFFQSVSFEFLCKNVDRLNLSDDLMFRVSADEYRKLVLLSGKHFP